MSELGKSRGVAFLLAHVDDVDGPCLTWPYYRDRKGYGSFGVNRKMYKAAAFMCELAHGKKPTPKHRASLSCGHGADGCVHPRHLAWRLPIESMALSKARGVHKRASARRTLLTLGEVQEMRALRGVMTQFQIGEAYGIDPAHVSRIHLNQQWTDGVPRHPQSIRRSGLYKPKAPRIVLPRALLSYPYIVKPRDEHADLLFINSLIPRYLPNDRRADICQEIWLSWKTGEVTREELEATRGRAFVRRFYTHNFEQGGRARTFDEVAFKIADSCYYEGLSGGDYAGQSDQVV